MREYKLSELKSSNILYNKDDPKMGFMIIGITLFLLIGIITIMAFTNKTEVIRSTGILSTTEKTYLMSQTGGRVLKVHKNNGDYVHKGELIIELDSIQTKAQILSLEYKLNYLNEYMKDINLFINKLEMFNYDDLNSNNNPFDKGELYYQYENFTKSINEIQTTKINNEFVEIKKDPNEVKKERMKVTDQYLTQLYTQKGKYEYDVSAILGQKDAYELTLDSYNIYATKSGYINYSNELNNSVVIGNDPIGTINEKPTLDNVIIETRINSSSINYIKEGYEVDILVVGLPQIEYGIITGKIKSISTDSLILEEGIYYKIIIIPNEITINDIELISGQATEIRVKYEESTWLKWLISKLGFK